MIIALIGCITAVYMNAPDMACGALVLGFFEILGEMVLIYEKWVRK